MKAGRELDALVAEKIMGWKVEYGELGHEHFTENGEIKFLPFYSTNISDAWEVVEKFDDISVSKDKKEFLCEIVVFNGNIGRVYEAYAETAPLAICLAALKAVGYDG
jgi:hypothetical protein